MSVRPTNITVSIIGAGNGGQALAGYMAYSGCRVRIYDRSAEKVSDLNRKRKIELTGALNITGQIEFATTDILLAIKAANIIMIATTATAHKEIAIKIAKHLEHNQIIVLNPGRTGGALEFKNIIDISGIKKRIYISEAQTLVYACRLIETGLVNIIGVKSHVLISALPASDTQHILEILNPIFGCFFAAKNVLQTSFENIGAMFHPTVVLFNEAVIERGIPFYFYRDMTDGLANLIEKTDQERLSVAKAYNFNPISAKDWVSYAYDGVEGNTLCERMQNNPAYYEILAPKTINCRQITEDIPTGIIPLSELGKAAGVKTPIFDSLINLCSVLLNRDFMAEGRTLKNLGLKGLSVEEIIKTIQ